MPNIRTLAQPPLIALSSLSLSASIPKKIGTALVHARSKSGRAQNLLKQFFFNDLRNICHLGTREIRQEPIFHVYLVHGLVALLVDGTFIPLKK